MAWLVPFPNDWAQWHLDLVTRAWPNPNSQRRFSPFWTSHTRLVLAPVMSRLITRIAYLENSNAELWTDIVMRPVDAVTARGDSGINNQGRRITCDFRNFYSTVPGFDRPGVRWQWRYHRDGFVDDVLSDIVYMPFDFQPLSMPYDVDRPSEDAVYFGRMEFATNWNPGLDTDWTEPISQKSWIWGACSETTPVPNN